MSLILCGIGEAYQIKKITGNDDTKRFLSTLGFIVGEDVKVVSKNGGNMIIHVKDTRIALDQSMASRIVV